ncbi:unnamed protein product [Dovyalis caffra]|uniref:peptidylprolyl isomerase n=1 Tax=Dovyalis caffra TaxID=77055 RepID=A0AAV1RHE3_9ROSI|nr:unnamed protein product [Dovyalis caffra]
MQQLGGLFSYRKAEAVIFPRLGTFSIPPPTGNFNFNGLDFSCWSSAPVAVVIHWKSFNIRNFCIKKCAGVIERREVIMLSVGFLAGAALQHSSSNKDAAMAAEFADMPALRGKDYGKTKMRYPDYTETESGLQYKDLRAGNGPLPKIGEKVVVDWDGYTIGYYGRIFEARNKTKGGSFEGDDKDFLKFRLGSREVIPAFEEAVSSMALGGIRRIIVPPELGYPENDYNKSGPKPTTFSGQRALDFVLRNQGLIDKTLLFDIELLKIIPS